MKEHKMSRRSFLKVGAVASAAGLMTELEADVLAQLAEEQTAREEHSA